MKMNTRAEAVIARLKEQGLTLATAESCTGGLIGKLLTDVPGASAVYKGGVISAVSVTGLAGPDGDGTGRPVGLVYIAVDTAGFSFCKELHLSGDRAKIREQAADAVFQLILDTI